MGTEGGKREGGREGGGGGWGWGGGEGGGKGETSLHVVNDMQGDMCICVCCLGCGQSLQADL